VILSDGGIRHAITMGHIGLNPYDSSNIQPASIDVTLDAYLVWDEDPLTTTRCVFDQHTLQPGDFVLGSTVETLTLGDDLVCAVNGKSSLGRLGITIHATAGYVDPGFTGQITLEISNISRVPRMITAGMKIGQLVFHQLDRRAEVPYGHGSRDSHYQNQRGPTPSWHQL
jgi:dCTP deaminase